MTVLPKDDRTDLAEGERLDLPSWTMILAICVVVDESKCLDTPIWEFSIIICEHLLFSRGYNQILHQLLVLRMTVAAVIYDADDPCSVNTA